MTENKKIWDKRWETEHGMYKNFEEYQSSMGVIVRDLLKELRKVIKKLTIKNSSVADIGGGYGVMLHTLIDGSNEKHLIEISEASVKIAKASYGIEHTHLVDLTENNFEKTDYFDYVLCNELLEHIHPLKVETLLKNIHSLIKPGGKIVVSTPNVRSITSFFLMLFGWGPFLFKMDQTHICPFTPKELVNIMEGIGFKQKKVFTTKALLFKKESLYIRFPFRWNLGEHIIGVWEK